MKLWQVMERAGQLNGAERIRLIRSCGSHEAATIPRAEGNGYSHPLCSKCWTIFSPSGRVLNPPRADQNLFDLSD